MMYVTDRDIQVGLNVTLAAPTVRCHSKSSKADNTGKQQTRHLHNNVCSY